MVWVCFASDSQWSLLWQLPVHGNLHQQSHHSTLQMHAIPSVLRLVWNSFIFQEDNDPKHTQLCKNYLTKNKSEGQLKLMTWPAQSPDLNLTEPVWDELDKSNPQVPFISGNCYRRAGKTCPGIFLWKFLTKCIMFVRLLLRQKVAIMRNSRFRDNFLTFFNIALIRLMFCCV